MRILSGLFWGVVLALLPVAPALAEEDNAAQAVDNLNAYAAYKSGDYGAARQMWQALAKAGNTTAMNNLANLYDQGQGVTENPERAVYWLQQAAEQGDRIAQLNLGLAYEGGRGVARNPQQAASWFREAAEQGDADAQFRLGMMLATNYGAGLDNASAEQRQEAREWLIKSATGNHPEASQYLALLPE